MKRRSLLVVVLFCDCNYAFAKRIEIIPLANKYLPNHS
ncbi:hypothetical protein JCM19296_2207 [Nonlabens ulvanivorans]|uniref:Uncharacterized protein n=1 Tax=Nonlabens ulvanivorans TaxID=906888 RepID=A0A081DCG4_NONUL|nr:hypothetical protein JCM19296_2207 [Nonlabens ulvanivorans]